MKYASINDIEIGNLVFGNSRGEYVVPRGVWQDVFCNFLERNDFSDYGFYNKGDEDYFENDTFIIRPYYWEMMKTLLIYLTLSISQQGSS